MTIRNTRLQEFKPKIPKDSIVKTINIMLTGIWKTQIIASSGSHVSSSNKEKIRFAPRYMYDTRPGCSLIKCPRTDISPRYDKLTNGRAVRHT